jgi:YkoY family integral membrane protein
MFGQEFDIHDLAIIGLLVVLEGVLSIDNALVLGLLAKRLPKHLQRRALTYGLVGAFAFRLVCIVTATWLLHWRIVKLIGGAYLIYVSAKHFVFGEPEAPPPAKDLGNPVSDAPLPAPPGRAGANFWPTVFVIEMTDIAFAVDSIVAAIGVVGPPPPGTTRHPKLWVVLTGGFIGVVVMRFAAVLFIRLLDMFPRFETAAYLLVLVIGSKLVAEWGFNTEDDPHRINFHDWHSPAFWIFWILMAACFCVGFIRKREPRSIDVIHD